MPVDDTFAQSRSGWCLAIALGVVAPVSALLLFPKAPVAALMAVGTMSTGMIVAALTRRLWIGLCGGSLTGASLVIAAGITGAQPATDAVWTGLAILMASFSFAARGALFARSASDKGWWIAVAVVSGEAAILMTAAASPEAIPDWVLVLLPAQWASMAFQYGADGLNLAAGVAALGALGATAIATLIVRRLWPRRWPYLVMFTTWIGMSLQVWQALH